MSVRRKAVWIILCLLALGMGLRYIGVTTALPSLENRSTSIAFVDTGNTRLGKAISPRVAANPRYSGIYPLRDARDAFAARVRLARAAERSLDIQYYIWQKDMTGTLLFNELYEAAERGVRVRLLLDDNNTYGLDPTLAALDAHPNIEIRLFNPFVIRKLRAAGYIFDFSRANRRMHNKSFTADNQVTIIGGRNVGDEYFGATDGVLFADLDVMAIGLVVNAVSKDFDRYWSSESSYPADRLLSPVDPVSIAELAAAASKIERNPAAVTYMNALRTSYFVQELTEGNLAMEWASVRMVSDDPAKGLGRARPEALLPYKLKEIIGKPTAEVDLVSPYFVPTAAGVESFVALANGGVKMKVLTNSLDATDVIAVHAGYAKRRKPLLKAGVRLFELRRLAPDTGGAGSFGVKGSSDSSLHAKTFSGDRSSVFIGSFNFDPRSAELNTEMGFIIDSPALARQIATTFHNSVPVNAYEVRLSDMGQLYWIEHLNGKQVRYDTEPGTSFWQRATVWLISMLPVEHLL